LFEAINLKATRAMTAFSPVHIIHPAEFDRNTAQTPGSARYAAITVDRGIETGLWSGTFLVEPGARTAIHHHGRQETIAYVLSGECEVQWGESGEFKAAAEAGDFIHVPPWLPHRESNLSQRQPFVWIVVRSTPMPIVVNLPEGYWR
jgi:uncharacterized RmlC-like cupin family protein